MGDAMSDADERRRRGSVPIQVHQTLYEEYNRTGSPPPAHVLSELTGIDVGSVRRALRTLQEEGLVAQPHGDRAPYIPLYRPDGVRMRHLLVPAESGEQPARDASALLEEALHKVRALEESQRSTPSE